MNTIARDLVVIGAGSGGIATAVRAALHGASVTLLDPGALGGTCVNVGCVPKKAMWIAAELAAAHAMASELGLCAAAGPFNWAAFVARRDAYIANIHASYERRFVEVGVEWSTERARLVAPDRVEAGGHVYEARHVLVATGSHPSRPPIPGAALGIDSDGFFALRSAPARVAIVGGGYIGVELAGVLNGLGSNVSLFVRGARVLGDFDAETTSELTGAMSSQGIDMRLRTSVVAAERIGDMYQLRLADGSTAGEFDELIWATGRRASSSGFGLEQIGVAVDREGRVVVDEWQDTNVRGVHAVGDVTPAPALTPVAVAAGRRLADRLFGGQPDARLDADQVPTVVFSHPPLAAIGCSEEEARRRHGDAVRVYRTRFRSMRVALAGRDDRTLMKLVCAGDDERIVGIHLFGREADEILQGFAVAMKVGARKRDFDETIAIHPTSAEELVLMKEPGIAFVGAAD
jgi:glutathione reductase (NADPH)